MIFLGCLFDRMREKEYLQNSKTSLANAANTFQWNLIDGFYQNRVNVTIFNALPVGIFPKQYKKLWLEDGEWGEGCQNCEIGCLNLPFIKQYQRYRKTKKLLRTSKDKNILIYSAYEPFLKAAYKLDKTYKITVIITDLPEFYDLGKTSVLKNFLRKRNNKKIYKYLSRANSFVILTQQMKEPLHIGTRPYIVVEGISNDKWINSDVPEKKSILYTGTLHKRFGILTLLEAFSLIENPDVELWICGGGDAKDAVEAASQKDSRIRFFGYVTKEKAQELQSKAFMLINPRQNEGEYTKYSFPSKTMEYMLSGKPVLMYRLDGIPAEYDPYLNYIDGNSAEDMKNAICQIINADVNETAKIGEAAARFIVENKNSMIQAKKIIKLMECL